MATRRRAATIAEERDAAYAVNRLRGRHEAEDGTLSSPTANHTFLPTSGIGERLGQIVDIGCWRV